MTLYANRTNYRSITVSLALAATLFATSAGYAQVVAGTEPQPVEPQMMAAVQPVSPILAGVTSPLEANPVAESSSVTAELPDAPVPAPAAGAADGAARPVGQAPKYAKYIAPGETVVALSGKDKFVLSLGQTYAPIDLLAMLSSAGYSQLVNGIPNYGTDRGAFGQRLGAAAIRETTQEVLTDGVFSPMFHVDPRYYVLGSGHSFGQRAVYAASNLVVIKSDSGHKVFNTPLFLGYAATSAMTPLYYPKINRNFNDVAADYGGSIGGALLGYFVDEFTGSLLKFVHVGGKQ